MERSPPLSSENSVGWLARIAFGLGSYAEGIKNGAFSYFLLFYYNQALGLSLFVLVGMLYERRHTREIAAFGGIARPMPVFAAFFGLVTMSSIGLPMLNGFVGELLILVGVYLVHPLVAVAAASGVVLAAAYMLWMYRRVVFGPVDNPENRGLTDLGLREKLVMLALVVPIVWIGIYPDPFLRRIEPSVIELLRQVEERGALAVSELAALPEAPQP